METTITTGIIGMNSSFETYIYSSIYILGIMKLLRMELITKSLFCVVMAAFSIFGIALTLFFFIAAPFWFFDASNETIGTLLKITLPINFIMVCAYNRSLIIDFFIEIKEEVKSKDSKLSNALLKSDPATALNNYFKIIVDDIEKQFFYVIGFFVLIQILLFDAYSYHHLPFFGSLYDYGFIYISKLHLLWLIPFSFLLTYFYSKYYFEMISNVTFEKFFLICVFVEHQGKQVVLSDYRYLQLIESESISSYFEVSVDADRKLTA